METLSLTSKHHQTWCTVSHDQFMLSENGTLWLDGGRLFIFFFTSFSFLTANNIKVHTIVFFFYNKTSLLPPPKCWLLFLNSVLNIHKIIMLFLLPSNLPSHLLPFEPLPLRFECWPINLHGDLQLHCTCGGGKCQWRESTNTDAGL